MNQLDLWRKSFNPFLDFGALAESMFRNEFPLDARRLLRTPCEISETATNYELRFDLPGMKREDIKIDLHENTLTVSGERREERKEEKGKVHYSEMSYGSFSRSYQFPAPVEPEKAEARFENGVLTVSVAKASSAKARQITVK